MRQFDHKHGRNRPSFVIATAWCFFCSGWSIGKLGHQLEFIAQLCDDCRAMDPSSLIKPPPGTAHPLRCAVYTRTSREGEGDGDRAFSSINALQEACLGYIAGHQHLGWLPACDFYDDPGFSGATLERPALLRLLQDSRRHRGP